MVVVTLAGAACNAADNAAGDAADNAAGDAAVIIL